MSAVPVDSEPYYDIDVIKENIEETGTTLNEAKLQNWGDESDREIDTELIYIFPTFPLTEALVQAEGLDAIVFKNIKQLSNERTEAKFWFKTNSDKSLLDQSDKNIEKFRLRLTEVPATTE